MQYNFSHFLQSRKIKDRSLKQIIEILNKVGIETEFYFLQNKNFYLDLKIPADRSDLKTFFYFFKTSVNNLNIRKINKWKSIKKNYSKLKFFKKEIDLEKNSLIFTKKNFINEELITPIAWTSKIKNKNSTFYQFLQEIYWLENLNFNKNYYLSLYNFLKVYQIKKVDCLLIKKENIFNNEKIISLRKDFLKQILDKKNFDPKVLYSLRFKIINDSKTSLDFSIPLYRTDLIREIDLVEEYCKDLEYKNFNLNYPTLNLVKFNKKKKTIELIKNFFLLSNYTEVFTTSLSSEGENNIISLLNPLNKELENLNKSLTLNHFEIFKNITKQNKVEVKVFEISRLFKKNSSKIKESDFLQCTKFSEFTTENFLSLWIKTKGDFDRFFTYFNIQNFATFIQAEDKTENTILYKSNNQIIAKLSFIKEPYSKNGSFIFQLNLNKFLNILKYPKTKKIENISKYPEIEKDLSFLCGKEINLYKVKKDILNNFKNIKTFHFFDIYIKKNVYKLGIRLNFQSPNKTLTNMEVEKEIENLVNYLKMNYNLYLTN